MMMAGGSHRDAAYVALEQTLTGHLSDFTQVHGQSESSVVPEIVSILATNHFLLDRKVSV